MEAMSPHGAQGAVHGVDGLERMAWAARKEHPGGCSRQAAGLQQSWSGVPPVLRYGLLFRQDGVVVMLGWAAGVQIQAHSAWCSGSPEGCSAGGQGGF